MAVRKGDRDQGKLQCLEASKELIKYTYDRVKDNEIFPKNQRWLMAKTIWDAACGAHVCIIRANANRGDSYYQQQRMTEFYYSEKARLKNGYYNQRTTPETGE